jgi:hypothetical protein
MPYGNTWRSKAGSRGEGDVQRSPRQHSLDFTIQEVSILFRDRPYSFSNGIKALIRVITREVEQFLTPR